MSNRRTGRRRHTKSQKKAAAKTAIEARRNKEQVHTEEIEGSILKQPGQQASTMQQKGIPKLVLEVVLALVTLSGGVGLLYTLRPQLTISATSNQNYRFNPVFTINNVGLLEVYDLTFACSQTLKMVADRDIENPRAAVTNGQNSEVGNNIISEKILRPQEPITKACPLETDIPGSHIDSAATILHISFRPSFWPWHILKNNRFRSKADSNGNVSWFPESIDAADHW